MKQKLKEAQLAEKRERREQKQQQREDKAMSRKQEKENRQMQKEQQKKDAQKQKEQARENFRQIREQEAEERNLRNQLVQNVEKEERPVRPPKKELSRTASYIPLKQVKNGIIQTSDNRFVKIVEVLPINFLLRSSSEQRSIILSFMSYLKIAPPNIQLKVLSRKADIQEYIDKIDEEAEKETDERCKILQEDYAELIK